MPRQDAARKRGYMQISDMLGQYSRNVTNGTEELHGTQSVQKIVSSVGELGAGSIFEGTINHVKGGKVTLALANGQTITARLDGKAIGAADLKPGSSMFFQVKTNDRQTVAIRPYTELGNVSNPILMNALSAAQIPVTDRMLRMVDAMMQEQLSIGKQSILDMAKLVNANPNANVQTIVQMAKLGLPVTEMMASQFEGYLSNQHELLNELELVTGQMLEVLGDDAMSPEESFALYGKLLDIFSSGSGQNAGNAAGAAAGADGVLLSGEQAPGQNVAAGADGVLSSGERTSGQNAAATDVLSSGEQAPGQNVAAGAGITEEDALWMGLQAEESTSAGAAAGGATLGELLTEEQLSNLAKTLQNIPTLLGNEELFAGAVSEEIFVDTLTEEPPDMEQLMAAENEAKQAAAVNKDMTAEQFLNTLHRVLTENKQYGLSGLDRLFAGKEFQQLFRHVIEKQWLIEPRELAGEKKIGALYEKMEQQIRQMETAVRAAGITQDSFLHTAADIRSNMEFMNQMNHIYNYVQIPLKMSGQNANGELYVYTNKKNFTEQDAELTAFLHLDMGNLGSTDVSVRMQNRQVRTNFYFEDDASYDLVEKHLPILEKRLKNKGYNCTITITNEKKNINFKENFLRKGGAPAGSLHRYSFDVRA